MDIRDLKRTPSKGTVTRRSFLKTGAIVTTALAAPTAAMRAATNKNGKLGILHIGVGGIGGMQRGKLRTHPKVEFVGLCDVDSQTLQKIGAEFPGAFKLKDYREAFSKYGDKFDAAIVDTPDFHHAPMMLTAMKHGKHIYGQKPLVHQLDEVRMIKEGLAARPGLETQMGNQRACNTGRMQAVEILRSNQLGRPIEAYVWTGHVRAGNYFVDAWSDYPPAEPVPANLDWNLWVGPIKKAMPYSKALAPRRWRTFWETGGGQLADWGCHLLDILYFAYDLDSPTAVMTHTPKPSGVAHSAHNHSVLTYRGGSRFAGDRFVVHYSDSGMTPSWSALGIPPQKVGSNYTMVVCEEGILLLQAGGNHKIFRKGKEVPNEPRPEVAPRDHWHDWVDRCFGVDKPIWTPFDIGVRITEPALLAVKATRYPGTELLWDGAAHRFTNNEDANETIVQRPYRDGFAPPNVSELG